MSRTYVKEIVTELQRVVLEFSRSILGFDSAHLDSSQCYNRGPDVPSYEGCNFNSGNYLFTTDTK